ncbi:MAG: SDR family oxidoreductase, partial [Candidatus Woesearchaeota archaeon]
MKNIFITGVSRGLGLEIVKTLLDKDYIIYGISREKSESIKELEVQYGERIKFYSFDIANIEYISSKLFKEFIPLNIPISGFVNNAAYAYDDIITNANYNVLKKSFDINFFGPVLLTKYIIRNMLFNNIKGSIVHISSISVHTGYKGLSMYAAS